MTPTTDDLAIAIGLDDAFLPGALVTLDSFRRQHRWFNGPIIVLHDKNLSSRSQSLLETCFDGVRFHEIGDGLRAKVHALIQHRPRFAGTECRFYSLETFALRGFRRVLFLDADLLFQAPIDALLEMDAPLVATPDRRTLLGDKQKENMSASLPDEDRPAEKTFNSGLMLLREDLLRDEVYERLLEMLRPDTWEGIDSGHTDQWLLNLALRNCVQLADYRYNFLLHIHHLLEAEHSICAAQAQVLHFNKRIKPWMTAQSMLAEEREALDGEALIRWNHAFAGIRRRVLARTRQKEKSPICYGAQYDPAPRIDTHLFIISPNNAGSTFLKNVLATSRHTWNLRREGQHTFGVAQPSPKAFDTQLVWAADPKVLAKLQDPSAYQWEVTRRAWYFHAFSQSPAASVFVEKSPPHLLQTEALRAAFHNTRFIFMIRNPYAMAEGILRRTAPIAHSRSAAIDQAALHIIACFRFQKDNILRHRECGVFVRYEDMCQDPETSGNRIRTLVPVLEDLYLDQPVEVKGLYHEPLRDMNADQIQRLSRDDRKKLSRWFAPETELMAFFGYDCL